MRSLTREHQPGVKVDRCVLLHEMVHAVHFQVFGSQNQIIRATYRQAMERHLYDEARRRGAPGLVSREGSGQSEALRWVGTTPPRSSLTSASR